MGGRGALSGLALYRDRTGKFVEYGTEYKTVLQDGNVKFVQMRNPNDSVRVPEETRTKGRIYVTAGKRGELKCITRYDEDGRSVFKSTSPTPIRPAVCAFSRIPTTPTTMPKDAR